MVGTEYPFRTVKACFLHRMLPKMRRVPQEAFLSTECVFRTVGGPLRYRMPQKTHRVPQEGVCVLGVAAVIFLLAAAFRDMFRAMPFSFLSLEAFSAGNALLFSGIRRIRYRRGPPTVRNMRAVLKKASCGTRRIFRSIRCKKQASVVRKGYSVPETPSYGTEPCVGNSLL